MVATSFAWHLARQTWGSDFWGHLAVVRELATHPLRPRHPQLLADYPHAFYSPYTLGLGLLSRLSGLEPIHTLALGGLLNLLLFLFALRSFSLLVSPLPWMPFWALLFTVFLWGPSAWDWGGFYNFHSIGGVLPFPSTFAMALALLTMVAASRFLSAPRPWHLLALPVGMSLVLLTHPLTATFMLIGLVAVAIDHYSSARGRACLILLGLLVVAVLLAAAWPYYPFLELVTSRAAQYDEDQQEMYEHVIERIFPALFGIPIVVARLRANHRDLLGLIFIATSALYVYGALSGTLRYGRMISYVALSLQLALAGGMARLLDRPALSRLAHTSRRLAVAGVLALCALSAVDASHYLQQTLGGSQRWYDGYLFLGKYSGQYDVVLSDLSTSNFVPAFGGKVVAATRFLAFVPDYEQRKADVQEFFERDTPQARREELLHKYAVDWLLVDREAIMGTGASLSSLQRLGQLAYEDRSRGLVLIKVSPRRSPG